MVGIWIWWIEYSWLCTTGNNMFYVVSVFEVYGVVILTYMCFVIFMRWPTIRYEWVIQFLGHWLFTTIESISYVQLLYGSICVEEGLNSILKLFHLLLSVDCANLWF